MEKILFVTSMRDMPDMTRQEIPIGSRQVSPLLSPPIKDGPILFISVDPPKVADFGIKGGMITDVEMVPEKPRRLRCASM
jgi:hypothetical protein